MVAVDRVPAHVQDLYNQTHDGHDRKILRLFKGIGVLMQFVSFY